MKRIISLLIIAMLVMTAAVVPVTAAPEKVSDTLDALTEVSASDCDFTIGKGNCDLAATGYVSNDGDYSYSILSDGTAEITRYYGGAANYLYLPSYIDGYEVTKIGYGAFYQVSDVYNVVVPSTVTTLDTGAFAKCTDLEVVYFGTSIKTIGKQAFQGCTKLKDLRFTSYTLKTIGDYAFDGCTGLPYAIILDGITSLGKYAFKDCTGLKKVTIGKSLKTIKEGTFFNCTALSSFSFGKAVTTIGKQAFCNCKKLTKVSIPASVKTLGDYQYYGCTGLKEISIGSGVKKIPVALCIGCKNLTKVTIPLGVTTIGKGAFGNCYKLKKVMVPSSVKSIGKVSLGFVQNSSGYDAKLSGFVLYGYPKGYAYKYAKNCGLKFVASFDTPVISKLTKASGGNKLVWKKVKGAAKYRVFRKTASTKWKKLGDTSKTGTLDKKIKSGVKYSYYVICISKKGKYTSFASASRSI